MGYGVLKSGSPAPKFTTSSPAAFMAFALAVIARVGEGFNIPARADKARVSNSGGVYRRGVEWGMDRIIATFDGKVLVPMGPVDLPIGTEFVIRSLPTYRVNFMGEVWGTVAWDGERFHIDGPNAGAIALVVGGAQREDRQGQAVLDYLESLPGRTRFVLLR